MLTTLEEPRVELMDKYREVHIEWSEYFNDASRTLNIETFLTVDEMRKFVRWLMGDAE